MIYRGEKTKNISFPLGGIGTGCIGLSGRGELIDWEIFNRPNKNTRNGYSHFALKVTRGDKSEVRVLQGDTEENLSGMRMPAAFRGFGFGPHMGAMTGYPHFRDVTFDGRFPIAHLTFAEKDFPVIARLTAFNPFIPHNEDDSSLPAAFFEWELESLAGKEIECAIAFSVMNPADCCLNSEITTGGFGGLYLADGAHRADEIGYSDLCVLTDGEEAVSEAYWYRGGWQDACTTYWKNFLNNRRLPARRYDEGEKRDHGTVASYMTLTPGERKRVRFVIAWNVPNQYNYWSPCKDGDGRDVTWKNYYATRFADSRAVAEYAMKNYGELYRKTDEFSSAIHDSSLPEFVTDAISSNLSVLKTPTALRLEDGSFWGWEGCNSVGGSCEGSCQHVWNYAYAMPFLFPRLERSMRECTVKYCLTESGGTKFRMPLPVGRELGSFRACVDGQMGEVIKCYREWKISGDNDWLKKHAPAVFKMLEYAWSNDNPDRWDADCDGILEGRQHHTLDMELFGPSSWLEGFYLLALKLGAQMADAVGEAERSEKYRALYENGKKYMNSELFNGEYFFHKVELDDKSVIDAFSADKYWNSEEREIKYQVAEGCIIDQMLADWHAAIIGDGGVFDAEKKKKALESLYKYNFKPSMRAVTNMWRSFALNDEAGTVICSYPDGVRVPAIPVPYCEETMTGFEYALAGLMIASGKRAEGEEMIRAVRDRYDGEKRNPWNEIECGSNYARSMASYALMPIYSGFTFDMTEKYIGFDPIDGEGSFLWSVGNTYGRVRISGEECELTVLGKPLSLSSFGIPRADRVLSVRADGGEISFTHSDDRIELCEVTVKHSLVVRIK